MMSALSEMVSTDGSQFDRSVIVDPAVFRAEMDGIFARTWVVVAHESQLGTPGTWDFLEGGRHSGVGLSQHGRLVALRGELVLAPRVKSVSHRIGLWRLVDLR